MNVGFCRSKSVSRSPVPNPHIPQWSEVDVDGKKVKIIENWPPNPRYPYTSSREAAQEQAKAFPHLNEPQRKGNKQSKPQSD